MAGSGLLVCVESPFNEGIDAAPDRDGEKAAAYDPSNSYTYFLFTLADLRVWAEIWRKSS